MGLRRVAVIAVTALGTQCAEQRTADVTIDHPATLVEPFDLPDEPVDVDSTLDVTVVDGSLSEWTDLGRADRIWGEAGPPVPIPGCRASDGFDCTANYEDQCDPACEQDQCCVGQQGAFRCVERTEAGLCPVADLRVDTERMRVTASVTWSFFTPNHCALVERCIRAPGWRRLLRFESTTANIGATDLFLGMPSARRGFEFSLCHSHFHFTQYENFSLLSPQGDVQITGRKQGFCILDSIQWPSRIEARGSYSCERQGLSTGWADVYSAGLDCQWLDVTDVPAGPYILRSEVNPDHVLAESNYANNVGDVSVMIPPDESLLSPFRDCAAPSSSLARQCGWQDAGGFACVPGAVTRVACSNMCGLGSCAGDTILRVCPGDQPCAARESLASNDDSLCSAAVCSSGGDCCSDTQVVCPLSGRIRVLWGARDVRVAAQCVPSVR